MLIEILVAIIVFGLFYWVVSLIPLPPPFPAIMQAVVLIALALYLLRLLGYSGLAT